MRSRCWLRTCKPCLVFFRIRGSEDESGSFCEDLGHLFAFVLVDSVSA